MTFFFSGGMLYLLLTMEGDGIINKLRFQTKLFLYVSIIIVLLFVVSGVILDHINKQSTYLSWKNSSTHTVNSLSAALTDALGDMNAISKSIHAYSSIQSIFPELTINDEVNYFDTHPREASRISHDIYTALSTSTLSWQITLISRGGDYLHWDSSANDRVFTSSQILALTPVHWALNTDDYLRYFAPYANPWHKTAEPIFSMARPLRNTYQAFGVIVCSAPVSKLDEICNTFLQDTDSYAAILDENDVVIYEFSPQSALDNEAYLALRNNPNNNGWQVNTRELGRSGLRLMQVNGDAALLEQLSRFRIVLLFFYVFVLILVLLCARLIMNRLTIPLRHLRGSLDVISLDEIIALPKISELDEIDALRDAITAMVERLRLQNDNLLNARERELQAQLNAMEAQLNSHFLYNTLAVIGAVGQMEGSPTTPRLCARLASLLRYSVDFNFKCVTLTDEIKNAQDFLSIMEMRHVGKTDFIWIYDSDVSHIVVPKLILQPIIENCFKHGFESVACVQRITIEIEVTEVRWLVKVTNNGVPPTQEAIDGIYKRFAKYRHEIGKTLLDPRSPTSGFGLSNTIMRLHLFYKGGETFHIQVINGQTIVTIGGPTYAP